MGITSHIEALVAALELNEVRLLRDAMRIVVPVEAVEARVREAAAIYEQRCQQTCCQDECCQATYTNPRTVHTTRTAAATAGNHNTAPVASTALAAEPQEQSGSASSPIQPPWEVLPWNIRPAPVVQLKRIIIRPDIIMSNRGAVIDLFI